MIDTVALPNTGLMQRYATEFMPNWIELNWIYFTQVSQDTNTKHKEREKGHKGPEGN